MTKEQAKIIGEMIAAARRKQKWSLRQLSVVTGFNHSWLSRLEQGAYASPGLDKLVQIAEVLNIDPKRFERIIKGQVSGNLPGMRTYFRSKYDLSHDEIDVVERTVREMQRKHDGDEL
jgi:transcriptional regulator with XRE-family HTH domain